MLFLLSIENTAHARHVMMFPVNSIHILCNGLKQSNLIDGILKNNKILETRNTGNRKRSFIRF